MKRYIYLLVAWLCIITIQHTYAADTGGSTPNATEATHTVTTRKIVFTGSKASYHRYKKKTSARPSCYARGRRTRRIVWKKGYCR
ncbi:hypothetical protein TI05_15315 [Achromatium sp. WMS3]|nr:hypothetical protein TI05_15315 [Achromatium sp. WMS3]